MSSFLRIFHSNLIASLEEGLEKGKFYSYESTSSAGNAVADERGGIRNGTRFNDPAEARLLPSSLMEHERRSVQHRFVGGGETVHAGSKSTRPCLNVRRIPVERDCVIRSFRSIRRGHRELSRRVLLSVSFSRGFVSFFYHSR